MPKFTEETVTAKLIKCIFDSCVSLPENCLLLCGCGSSHHATFEIWCTTAECQI